MFDHVKKTAVDGRPPTRAGIAVAVLACGALLLVPPSGVAIAEDDGRCTPTDAWTETIPAQGEPTILVDNPDYVPEVLEVTREVHHPAITETVCHDAVTHQEYRFEIERPYWTVEHKDISVAGLSETQKTEVIQWLTDVRGADLGDGWWNIPDAVIAAVNFNPVTVADTGTVGLRSYGGPDVTVSYRKSQEIHSSEPSSGFGIQQSSVQLYWNGARWVTGEANAAWVTQAPPHGVMFDERTITDEREWCGEVEIEPGWTETVVDQEYVPAQGEPQIEVPNPEYVPERIIRHPAVTCGPEQPTDPVPEDEPEQPVEPAGPALPEAPRPVVQVTG